MGCIYKFTNIRNNKVYIGQTCGPIEDRIAQHKWSAMHGVETYLYNSIRKYGMTCFKIDVIEECDDSLLNDREKYWINYYNSYNNGYNLTPGGDGNQQFNYKEIADKYLELKNQQDVAKFFHCGIKVVQKACKTYNIKLASKEIKRKKSNKGCSVARIDPDTKEILEVYSSLKEIDDKYGDKSTISKVCRGERKKAMGYGWQYIKDPG